MVYLFSFGFFLFFAGALALGMIINKRPLKTEDEATAAILKGLHCASCTSTLCSFSGKSGDHSSDKCDAAQKAIPHKNV